MEDDGQRVREREPVDAQRDGRGAIRVDERAAQQLLGVVVLRILRVVLVHRLLSFP